MGQHIFTFAGHGQQINTHFSSAAYFKFIKENFPNFAAV